MNDDCVAAVSLRRECVVAKVFFAAGSVQLWKLGLGFEHLRSAMVAVYGHFNHNSFTIFGPAQLNVILYYFKMNQQ